MGTSNTGGVYKFCDSHVAAATTKGVTDVSLSVKSYPPVKNTIPVNFMMAAAVVPRSGHVRRIATTTKGVTKVSSLWKVSLCEKLSPHKICACVDRKASVLYYPATKDITNVCFLQWKLSSVKNCATLKFMLPVVAATTGVPYAFSPMKTSLLKM